MKPSELKHYLAQTKLPEVGEAGQEKLKKARVLVVGLGGLGTPAATYLTAAGVGNLGLCDPDKVSLTNLNRQFLYRPRDVGKSKALCLAARLKMLNSHVKRQLWMKPFDRSLLTPQFYPKYDFVLECSDNLETKLQVSKACREAGVPHCHAGVSKFRGQLLTVVPGSTCYNCLHGRVAPENTLGGEGILGPTVGLMGTMQAMEALKFFLDLDFGPRLVIYDSLACSMLTIAANQCSCA